MYFSGMCGTAVIVRYFSRIYIVALLLMACITSCKYKDPSQSNRVSFKQVTGINYIEVKRRFADGLSFNKYGYELTPSWKLSFYSDDSAKVYNPDSGRFLGFHVTLDHDSLFYVSRAWFRAKKVTKDSIFAQVMKVQSNVVYLKKSSVYITFYSDKYIRNVLHTTPEKLTRKTKQDTAFIRKRSAEVNANTDSAFAAREPIAFKTKSALAKVEKVSVEANLMNNYDNSDEYMFPEFNININKAYQDFFYTFLVTVDYKGEMHFQYSLMKSVDENMERKMEGVLNGYVKSYIAVQPGSTFGIPHNSYAILNVVGKKGN
jgi:hypothetical protein